MFHNVKGEPIPIHLDSATYLIDTKTVNSESMYPRHFYLGIYSFIINGGDETIELFINDKMNYYVKAKKVMNLNLNITYIFLSYFHKTRYERDNDADRR